MKIKLIFRITHSFYFCLPVLSIFCRFSFQYLFICSLSFSHPPFLYFHIPLTHADICIERRIFQHLSLQLTWLSTRTIWSAIVAAGWAEGDPADRHGGAGPLLQAQSLPRDLPQLSLHQDLPVILQGLSGIFQKVRRAQVVLVRWNLAEVRLQRNVVVVVVVVNIFPSITKKTIKAVLQWMHDVTWWRDVGWEITQFALFSWGLWGPVQQLWRWGMDVMSGLAGQAVYRQRECTSTVAEFGSILEEG